MKKFLAMLLALASVLLLASCGTATEPSGDSDTSSDLTSGETSQTSQTDDTDLTAVPEVRYGVYYFVNDQGQKLSRAVINNDLLVTDKENDEDLRRFTVYWRTTAEGEKHYMFYKGDDTRTAIGGKDVVAGSELTVSSGTPGDNNTFDLIPNEDGSKFKIVCATHPELCLTYNSNGDAVFGDASSDAASNYWSFETAPSEDYVSFSSKYDHIVLRVPEKFTTRATIGLTPALAQMWVDYFEEAYFYEIELTGYTPYDTIVIKAYEDENIVAGVVNNYNVIVADVGFMQTEFTSTAQRYNKYGVLDLTFGMLHEMGHMFDSNRGWNFESEAWTDLKLCYCLYKLEEKYPDQDFAATPVGYAVANYTTYDKMEECLGHNSNNEQGGMIRVYSFWGCAKIFLQLANDFGWDPYIQTFHWFQDNGKVESDYERIDRFYTFMEKLGEYSGKNIKDEIDKLNPKAWQIMVDYYSGVTNEAI